MALNLLTTGRAKMLAALIILVCLSPWLLIAVALIGAVVFRAAITESVWDDDESYDHDS